MAKAKKLVQSKKYSSLKMALKKLVVRRDQLMSKDGILSPLFKAGLLDKKTEKALMRIISRLHQLDEEIIKVFTKIEKFRR